ncbi:protein scarlet [Ischnura elegans]|uniref:protein scarlet n=1 Tax=Ischnura elegans TaxID=197161 RepID=UPI001ED88F22|nr:protein scarlet [Ischnura elegans]XP_046390562.1 protein scarlet [Ischnura elegans]
MLAGASAVDVSESELRGAGSLGMLADQGSWCAPREGLTLTWRDLSVYVHGKGEGGGGDKRRWGRFTNSASSYKRVLNNVSGVVRPGSLVALMGASGAGKSTLMNALAHRSPAGVVIDGDIRVNGRPTGDFMSKLCGYVHQEDIFVGALTVRETLNFMAWLRLDRRTTRSERRRQVADLISHLGLGKCADTRIGSTGHEKVLSGGEKKRLAFAIEMLTDPPLLFCDEPTTGLDSYSARKLVRIMQMAANGMAWTGRKNSSRAGKTKAILCTIHQPSSEVFALFSQIVLLVEGRVAFSGTATGALAFFSSLGYTCPPNFNPADFLIRTLAHQPELGNEVDSSSDQFGQYRRRVKRICDRFAVSDYADEVELLQRYEAHMAASSTEDKEWKEFTTRSNFWAPLWIMQLFWLTYRSLVTVVRDPSVQTIRILQKVAIAIMAGLCYFGVGMGDQRGIQAVQGALFIFVTENTFAPMYSVLAVFPQEMPLFNREYKAGLYNTHAYYLSKMLAMIPGLIVEPFLFVLICYWLIGLRSSTYAFLMTVFISVLTMNVSAACGCFFSTAFDSVAMAMTYLVPFDFVLMATAGLFIKISTIPNVIGWVKYLSWLMYSNEAMSIVQWDGIHNITCEAVDQVNELPCLTEGSDVLDKYSFSVQNLSRNINAMIALYFAFHILGYICLRYRTKKNN